MEKFRTRMLCCVLCLLGLAAGSYGQQKNTKVDRDFLIDPNRPFVYIKFDHVGQAAPWSEDESPRRIWLRLTNNCRVPISVLANGVPDDSPKDEVGVMYDVVPVRPVRGVVVWSPSSGHAKTEAVGSAEEDAEKQEIPRGRIFDVGSIVVIEPGEDILFSVPTNHVTKRWYPEISFNFELPAGKGHRDPKISLGPDMRISYTWSDLPPDQTKLLEK